jgi:hypothetical protein
MIWIAAVGAGAVTSCGSRTGLFEPNTDTLIHEDPTGKRDGGRDTGRDVASDVPDLDSLPPIDVTPKPDVDRTGCQDADETYVYVVTEQYELLSFFPPTLQFTSIGKLACPSAGTTTPFSMAVDRKGVAYVVYTDGKLYRVSTATGACIGTSYVPDQLGFHNFGMGFASDFGGPAEHLYVSENSNSDTVNLGRIDIATMKLALVGPFNPVIPRSELTGTGDGRLFAFWPNAGVGATGSHIAEVNKATAEVVGKSDLTIGSGFDAFAFAFWGGEFWIFTGQSDNPSVVTRFRPSDGTAAMVTTHPSTIVGAGVSTCAPQQ